MKKLALLLLTLLCALSAAGCQKTVSGPEVYSFPEPTLTVTGTHRLQGKETPFEIGSAEYDPNDLSTLPVIQWFYGLKLTACDKPKETEAAERYDFCANGEPVFAYEVHGRSAYILLENDCYKVKNPSAPPIR